MRIGNRGLTIHTAAILRPIGAPRERSGLGRSLKPEWSGSARAESGVRGGLRKPLCFACRSKRKKKSVWDSAFFVDMIFVFVLFFLYEKIFCLFIGFIYVCRVGFC